MKNPFEFYSNIDPKASRISQLEWEESALDSESDVEAHLDQHRHTGSFWWAKIFLIVALLGLGSRLFYLQVVSAEKLQLVAEGNRTRKATILAPRGVIQDRNGKVLAENIVSFNLVAVPFDLPSGNWEENLKKLSEKFGFDFEASKAKILKAPKVSFIPITLRTGLTDQQSILFQTEQQFYPGFSVQNVPGRKYIDPELFSHIIGYTGSVTDKDLERAMDIPYDPLDVIGKTGIESSYEEKLRGINGRDLIEVDAAGRLVKSLGAEEPSSGSSLKLTLDSELQRTITNSFKWRAKGQKGAVVVLNPKNGEVLALVSLPSFNNNLFTGGISQEDYGKLSGDKDLPLFNRAIGGTYPPGSTVKPMVGLAALEEGLVTENTIIEDTGKLVVPNQFNPKISYDFWGWKKTGLGPMNVKTAIAMSSDIYFYVVSGGHPNYQIKSLGISKLSEWYTKFGLGRPTGLDIGGERSGVVADPEWKNSYFKDDPILAKWYLGDTYHVGIGQGDMLVTPLQVAYWTSFFAANGKAYKPHLISSITSPDKTTVTNFSAEESIFGIAKDENVKIIQKAMRETVLNGSARKLLSLPITSAGKTGTSQFDGADKSKTHAWYTCYAPYENPEIVITVLVEAGGEGNEAAVPIAGDILSWWASHREVK